MAFEAKDHPISDILTKSVFDIPRNQRRYVWKKENWQDLYEDIVFSITEKKPHFIGSIVLEGGQRENGLTYYEIYSESGYSSARNIAKRYANQELNVESRTAYLAKLIYNNSTLSFHKWQAMQVVPHSGKASCSACPACRFFQNGKQGKCIYTLAFSC